MSVVFGGQAVLGNGPAPNLWRPTTDNDEGGGPISFAQQWIRAGYNTSQLTGAQTDVSQDSDLTRVTLSVAGHMPITSPTGRFSYQCVYVVTGDGQIDIQAKWQFAPDNPSASMTPLPRVGVLFEAPTSVRQMTWYGHGPHENYPDRLKSAPVGVYTATVADLHTDYIKPQENGGRGGIRWATLLGSAFSVTATALPGTRLHSSLSRYTMDNLLTARHTKDLVPAASLSWHIDCAQAGLGGDTSWTPQTHLEYQLRDTEYALSFTVMPAIL